MGLSFPGTTNRLYAPATGLSNASDMAAAQHAIATELMGSGVNFMSEWYARKSNISHSADARVNQIREDVAGSTRELRPHVAAYGTPEEVMKVAANAVTSVILGCNADDELLANALALRNQPATRHIAIKNTRIDTTAARDDAIVVGHGAQRWTQAVPESRLALAQAQSPVSHATALRCMRVGRFSSCCFAIIQLPEEL